MIPRYGIVGRMIPVMEVIKTYFDISKINSSDENFKGLFIKRCFDYFLE